MEITEPLNPRESQLPAQTICQQAAMPAQLLLSGALTALGSSLYVVFSYTMRCSSRHSETPLPLFFKIRP